MIAPEWIGDKPLLGVKSAAKIGGAAASRLAKERALKSRKAL
jgi:hypothetical protein